LVKILKVDENIKSQWKYFKSIKILKVNESIKSRW
jgi:hypothetical protein